MHAPCVMVATGSERPHTPSGCTVGSLPAHSRDSFFLMGGRTLSSAAVVFSRQSNQLFVWAWMRQARNQMATTLFVYRIEGPNNSTVRSRSVCLPPFMEPVPAAFRRPSAASMCTLPGSLDRSEIRCLRTGFFSVVIRTLGSWVLFGGPASPFGH